MLLELAINLFASVILLGAGFVGGKYRERKLREGKNLEEYDFYPFGQDEKKHVFFDAGRFAEAVRYLGDEVGGEERPDGSGLPVT